MVAAGYALAANTGLSALVGFAYWVVAARLYDAAVVGRAGAALSLVILVSAAARLELPLALSRYLASYPNNRREIIRSAYGTTFAMGLLAALAVAALGAAGVGALADVGLPPVALAAFLVLWSLFVLQDGALVGLGRSNLVLIENLLFGIAKLVLLAIFASSLPSAGIVASWALPLVVAVIGVSWWLYRSLGHRSTDTEGAAVSIDWREVRSFVAGQHVASMLGLAAAFGPPILVEWYYGGDAAGRFYIAWITGTTLIGAVDAFATSLTVEASAERADIVALTKVAGSRAALLFIPAGLALIVGAPLLLRVFGGDYAAESTLLLRLLGVGTILRIPVALFLAAARARGDVAGLLQCQVGLTAVSLAAPIALLGLSGPTMFGLFYVVALVLALAVLGVRGLLARNTPSASRA